MTLNQAIDGYTNNAEYERRNGNLQGCLDFRQLADWLKDYKRLLEQEPKTGHWTHDGSHWKNRFICSECGYKLFDEPTNFCPNCGAKMVEPQESEDKNG